MQMRHCVGRAVTLGTLAAALSGVADAAVDHRYCIIGAGPGAVQMGHYMLRAGMDYMYHHCYHIFERNGARSLLTCGVAVV